ncbi:hypothetical protein COLO4_04236 [Corchorus olitorius]|uniref:Uncharacterized protein n=1 Tax=Corchorus olitorius TaxID=93759 RepID=A0A1R3KUQ1_9ROSI|nr:hypothetical protein COLO4_04236 [Corchorus olitorius]
MSSEKIQSGEADEAGGSEKGEEDETKGKRK